jgi:hypothetical protein
LLSIQAEAVEHPLDPQKGRWANYSQHGATTAPWPVFWPGTKASAHRVQSEIARQFEKVTIALNRDRMETALKEMAAKGIPAVERLRVSSVHALNPAGKIRFGRLDNEVVVVFHQAIRVEKPSQWNRDPRQ